MANVQPSAGRSFEQQLKAVWGSLYSFRYKGNLPRAPTLNETVQYFTVS
jgi:hypothetical protein